jgi:pilus assembly protein CpaC
MNPACTTGSRGQHRSFVAALVVFIIVILVAAPQAQQQAPASFASNGVAPTAPPAANITATDIDLLVGRSTILNVGSTIKRVSLTVPDVADALVTTPTQLLIHGKQPGTISLFVWDNGGLIRTYEVNVRRDLNALKEQVQQLFAGEPISIVGSGKDVVLSGTVSSKYVVEKAAEVAGGYVEKKENVVNLLQQQEGVASNQVLLRVRFAEVSRSALQELGAAYIANGFKDDWFGRATTQQFAAPDFDSDKAGGLTFSDFLNVFVFNTKHNIGAVIKALQNKGLFQSLAEPNLIALNGKEASFLAGGEYPYPVVQPSAGATSITIQFKEFGVRLSFTPTVLQGDLIDLKVRPEVSSLDFSNAITLQGFRIPALTTRRTDTEVELRDGQTFAIAGLLNNTANSTMAKIPGIGDIPILGYLFRSRAYQKQQTELVVMITPQIVRRGSMGVSEGLPALVEPYLGAPSKTLPPPAPYVGSPRYPAAGQPAPRGGASAPAPQPQPVARPIQGSATLPQPSSVSVPADASPAVANDAAAVKDPAVVAPPPPTKEELKAAERARIEDAKRYSGEAKAAKAAADAEAKLKAEQDRKDAEAKRQADKAAKEQAARDAEIARRKAEQDAKREKALAEAAARLKAAQAEYQAEIEKAKGSSNDKTKTSGKGSSPQAPK